MSITTNYAYLAPELAEYFEEAFERAGVAPLSIGQEHIDSALRSVRFLFSEWNTYGMREWMIKQHEETLSANDGEFDMPAGAIWIVNAVVRRDSRDTPMYPMSRSEYLELADKTAQGRPTRYFAEKRYNTVTMKLWQLPENSTDIMVIDYVRTMANPGEMINNLELPPTAYEAFVAGLAMRLAQKFSPERYEGLKMDYGGRDYPERLGGKLYRMRASTGDDADVMFTFRR